MYKIVAGFLFILLWACDEKKGHDIPQSYAVHCGSCHLPPKINDLPKQFWTDRVLPDMASRLGIATQGFDPMSGLSFEERKAIIASGIFPTSPVIDPALFKSIADYIVTTAPDSLPSIPEIPLLALEHYRRRPVRFPDASLPSFTYLNIRDKKIEVGDVGGSFWTYDLKLNTWEKLHQFESPVVGYAQIDSLRWALTVGLLDPSEQSQGKLYELGIDDQRILLDSLHRPVYLEVLEKEGDLEFTIAEFGHNTGRLSGLLRDKRNLELKTLIPTPGAIRIAKADIDGDNKQEKLVLFAQGDERLVAIRDQNGKKSDIETLLRFSPLSGVSWFEVTDIDGDGDLDLITVHGDNADKTYIQKPYHGLRIHHNDGAGRFTQVYNYPMNGATRVAATDWDMDGDQDLAVVSAFPDYSIETPRSFIVLENTMQAESQWRARSIPEINEARWFLMDSGDLDKDGDKDIVLGVFNYHITPVPKAYLMQWNGPSIGLLILENTLIDDQN